MSKPRSILLLVAGSLLGGVAVAHPGHESTVVMGFEALRLGFAHPWSGLDHLLAMLAVGLWAAQSGRRAMLSLPLVFPVLMLLGALAGRGAELPPQLETFIAASVLALGLLVALQARWPLRYGAAVVGVIGLAHGFAHGAELPQGVTALPYFVGFAVATLLLHVLGMGAGIALARLGRQALPACGGAIAAVGLLLTILH